jgi:ketosteroid isomerase-like protein
MGPDVVDRFYTGLAGADAATMVACYADEVVFSDPVFGELHGAAAGDMWRMLCRAGADLVVTHEVREATSTAARVDWRAAYTFAATGRSVVNHVTATMRLRDGLIVEHRDTFDLWRWSRQALGPVGVLFGWTPQLQARVRRDAHRALARSRTQG